MPLYHDTRYAAATIRIMPNTLMAVCSKAAARRLRDHELARKRQKYPQAENLQRMLAADYRRPEDRRFQARPMPRHEADGDGGERQEMRKPQHIEIGLIDRIHPIRQPAGHETIEQFERARSA